MVHLAIWEAPAGSHEETTWCEHVSDEHYVATHG